MKDQLNSLNFPTTLGPLIHVWDSTRQGALGKLLNLCSHCYSFMLCHKSSCVCVCVCVCVSCSVVSVAQLCLTLCDPPGL